MGTNRRKTQFLGIEFFPGDIKDLEVQLSRILNSDKQIIHFVAASTIVAASENSLLQNLLHENICVVDSKPLHWFFQFKFGNTFQIRGTDFMRKILFDPHDKRIHFLLGSTSKNLKDIERNVAKLNSVKGRIFSFSPEYFADWHTSLDEWASLIRNSNADVIWIGMGSPKQDFIAQELSKRVDQPIVTVGAAFDFISENKSEAPPWLRSIGFEWFFRLLTEPRRLFYRYTVGNVRFIILVIKEMIRL